MAVAFTREFTTVLESYVDSIKEKNENLPKVPNGPEGSISYKTYDSIKLLGWGLISYNQTLKMMLIYLVL